MDRRTHWNDVYRTKPPSQVSWFEADPHMSLDLILNVAPNGGRLIDIGGGTSFLVDRLLAWGNWQVTVLDVSSQAIERAQARLGDRSKGVRWMTTDITEVTDLGAYDIWHDRAVFHFLTAPEDRIAYRDRMRGALQQGGHANLATFAPSGPEKCSGLPVCRYDADSLAKELGEGFAMVKQLEHPHRTPDGKVQPFTFCVFRRV
jgi:2-polyprenyl-3-methyl-5-hydroxy-6-metoxy-1,4-benzoquinol methylase